MIFNPSHQIIGKLHPRIGRETSRWDGVKIVLCGFYNFKDIKIIAHIIKSRYSN